MDEKDLAEALAVIYDPIRGNMLTTRSVLHGMGFRRIDGITSFELLERRLKDNDITVLFVEASEDSKEITQLLQSVRIGEIKSNPFLPIIATLWHGSGEAVAGLLNCGADDVLLRPFSVNRAQERIKALIDNRRKFVVTSDYVGPDRGKPNESRNSVEAFEVPNALKFAVGGENSDPVAQNELMREAKKRVHKERLAKLARRIAMAAEVTIQADGYQGDKTGFVADLLETCAELVRTAKSMELEEVQDIAAVLENVVEKAATESHNRVENAELARQLALAIFVAYAVDESEAFKKELEQVLEKVRTRLDKARHKQTRRGEIAKSGAKLRGLESLQVQLSQDSAKSDNSFMDKIRITKAVA